jgi:uncharacterized SAM-binding protein YcdF (DUF218 family)
VTEEEEERPGRFHGFFGGVRLIFDGMLFLMVLFFIGFAVFASGVEDEPREVVPSAEGITVLTGGPDRIDQAMKLLAQGKGKRVLITGVYRSTTREELKQLASQGDQYFACCVDIDKEARNTIDNATETSEWVARHHFNSVIVVTSNYHMPRALAELGRAMPDVVLISYPVIDKNVHLERWWTYPGTSKLLMSEYLKYLPALARLGATRLANLVLPKGNKLAEAPEP